MRVFGWLAACIPCSVLFDFLAAFPMLAQKWIWTVLRALGCPPGLQRILTALYFWAATFDNDILLWLVLSGLTES